MRLSMAKSIIHKLANEAGYLDDIVMYNKKEYAKLSKDFEDIINKLCEGMTDEEKYKIIFDFDMARCGMEALTADEHFKRGFKLGLLIGAQNFLE